MTDRAPALAYLVTQADLKLSAYHPAMEWDNEGVLAFVRDLIASSEDEMRARLFPEGIVQDDELALDAARLVAQHEARLAGTGPAEQLGITPMEKRLGRALSEVLRRLPDGLAAPERDFAAEVERRITRFKGENWADEKGKKSVITGMRIAQEMYRKHAGLSNREADASLRSSMPDREHSVRNW